MMMIVHHYDMLMINTVSIVSILIVTLFGFGAQRRADRGHQILPAPFQIRHIPNDRHHVVRVKVRFIFLPLGFLTHIASLECRVLHRSPPPNMRQDYRM